jgi:hypothetical protein
VFLLYSILLSRLIYFAVRWRRRLKPLNRAEWLEAALQLAIRTYSPQTDLSGAASTKARAAATGAVDHATVGNEEGGESPLPLLARLVEEKLAPLLPRESLTHSASFRADLHSAPMERIFKVRHLHAAMLNGRALAYSAYPDFKCIMLAIFFRCSTLLTNEIPQYV